MIEAIVRNFLLSQTAITAPVYIDAPSDPPARRVVIERTGGGMVEHIRNAQIAIQSYGARRSEAAELHELILEIMPTLAALPNVSACDLSAEYDFTDSETKEYRYQSVFSIVYYGG